MSTHGMIDLETLSTRPDATLLTLGAIKFDPYSDAEPNAGLYLRVDVDEQSALGRHVDENTLEEIRNEALGDEDRISLSNMIKQLNKWCVGVDELWCQGPLFDYAILQNLYAQLGQPCPWNYWQIRDSRTLFNMLPKDPRKDIQMSLHNALADCYFQAKSVQKAYKHFGVKSRWNN
jgi:hypothetical protein